MIRFWQRFKRATHHGPDADISTLVRREFGLRVRQRRAYEEALTHSSMLDGDTTGLKSNERLEFLGDVVLDMTMAQYLYRNFPDAQEGELTKRKSRVVNRKNLNLLGKNMGLQHLIRAKMRREDIHETLVGNALEALIGALYLDHGFQKTQRAVLLMLKHYGLEEQVHETRDFKSQLHHWASKRKKNLTFRVVKENESAGEQRYEIEVIINGTSYGAGVGRSKKEAEQEAARRAWRTVFERRQASGAEIADATDGTEPAKDGNSRGGRGEGASRRRPARKPRRSAASAKEGTPTKKATAAKEATSAKEGASRKENASGKDSGSNGSTSKGADAKKGSGRRSSGRRRGPSKPSASSGTTES